MFIRVDLPAPFSPNRQWISPGSTVRSMAEFAATDPNVLVMPRSSSRIRCFRFSRNLLRLGRRLDRDGAGGDLGLQRGDLALQVARDRGEQLLAVDQVGAAVGQVQDVLGAALEVAGRGVLDDLLH